MTAIGAPEREVVSRSELDRLVSTIADRLGGQAIDGHAAETDRRVVYPFQAGG